MQKHWLDSEDDDSEDDDNEDINMVKKPAATKIPKTPKAPAKDKEVDDLADQVQSQVNLGSWFMVDCNQHFGVMAIAFTNPANKMCCIHICTEFVGGINSDHIEASMSEDGDCVKINVKFPHGGELTNPKHVLTHCEDSGMDELHLLCLAVSNVHHFCGEANEKKEEELLIKLPFTCDPHGFCDPVEHNDVFLDLGIFLLDATAAEGKPAPSTKFLHLFCEEQKKAKLQQKTQQHSHFKTPSPIVPVSGSLGSSRPMESKKSDY
jgi:hypothetical protein